MISRDALLRWPDAQAVLLPWRRDPHDDNWATRSISTAVLDAARSPSRRLEYPIWTMVRPGPDDLPCPGGARLWRLDIGSVVSRKRAAILAHRSQTTALVDDAEIDHCLTEPVLERFAYSWELLLWVEP